ncbi:AI-2E family transporter [Virgibacillus siamensis]|uniref:AI-2E family transporter n=1 Tax=Virgibacillus siamensis TaxID=480071 RepID=A0ABN1FX17_9BACI
MWIHHNFFKYMTGAILIVIFIFFLGKIDFFLAPFKKVVATLFFPIIFAGLLYYILKPVVKLFSKPKYMTKSLSILLVYIIIGILTFLVGHFAGSVISQQFEQFSNQIPNKIEQLTKETKHLVNSSQLESFSFQELKQKAVSYFGNLLNGIGSNISQIISLITGIATTLVIVPFILFYFLKDDRQFASLIEKLIPKNYYEEGKTLLNDIDHTLSAYIIGQLTVAFVDGFLMYIGYLILGVPYAAILGIFVMITAIIPLIGPLLGIIPAIMLGLLQNPVMVIYIFILMIAVQQLEGNLISPQVLGKRLDLHPLTVILLLIVAGALYGFIGVLLAVPLYAVLKVTIKNFYKLYRLPR